MDVREAIFTRRSVRSFRGVPIARSTIEQLIEAATCAPSAHDRQPWEFVVVTDRLVRKRIAATGRWAWFLPHAAVGIVVCIHVPAEGPGSREWMWAVQDAACACENILLVAHAVGLGACWIGDFSSDVVRKELGIPEGIEPVAVLAVGVPELRALPRRCRRPVSEVLHWEKYGRDSLPSEAR